MNTTPKPPQHTFPGEYMIKIVGDVHENFPSEIVELISSKAEVLEQKITDSKNKQYQSLSVRLFLQSEADLEFIYEQIKEKPYIKMIF